MTATDESEPPPLGHADFGTFYANDALPVTHSATFSAYIEVYPEYDAEELVGYADGYYDTATNRTQASIEFLARFRRDMGNEPDGWLQIYDWSCQPENPCDNGYDGTPQGPGGPNGFVRSWHMPDKGCWYEMLEDNTGHYVNYVFFRNSSWILDPRNPPEDPPLWRNSVSIKNTCTGEYDGVYSHDFARNQPDCSLPGSAYLGCRNWAGILERFPTLSTKPPAIVKMGFHQQNLEYDGQSSRLLPGLTWLVQEQAPYWQRYAVFPNDTYEVGTYQDDDGDDLPNSDDHDIDGDGVNNGVTPSDNNNETQCGATASSGEQPEYDPYVRPERVDGVFAGVDDDGDTLVDEPLPSSAANRDCDGDGYNGGPEGGTPLCGNGVNDDGVINGGSDDSVVDDGCPGGPSQVGAYSEGQFNIGLTDQDPCGTNGWPSDFVSGGVPDSTNKINILDWVSFQSPVNRMNTSPGNPAYNARWDLQPGRGAFGNWINVTDLTSTTGR